MDFGATLLFPFSGWYRPSWWDSMTAWAPSACPCRSWTWTLSIIGLVLVIRAALIPVSLKQIKAQRRMRQLQPDLKALQEKYKGRTDALSRQAMAQEQMALYKTHGTNPFTACLPLLVQVPFFFALFTVLSGITTAASTGTGIGAMSHEQAVQFDESSILGAPLSASVLTAPPAAAAWSRCGSSRL